MAEDRKVFDVAKPGSTKPDTGSKPMVVGHKIMKDPTLVDTEPDEAQKVEEIISQPSKVTVSPISEEFASVDGDKVNEASDDSEEADTSEATSLIEETKTEDTPTTDDTKPESQLSIPEETPEEKKENADTLDMERELNLQKIIKEKTYVVPVQEATYSAFKTFIKTFLVVGLLGVAVLVILIDAEIIDVGITLPFDIL
jgi:hypothetical protein